MTAPHCDRCHRPLPHNAAESRVCTSSHTRSETEWGPDYCAECSDAAQQWVRWPCAAWLGVLR